MEFDVALREAGSFGLYQKLLLGLMVVPSGVFCAFVYFCQYFIILIPSTYHCKLPFNETQLQLANVTFENAKRIFIPDDSERCHIQIYENVTSALLSPRSAIPLVNETCEEYTFQFEELYPTIATDMGLVCEKSQYIYLIQTLFYVASSLGAIIFGIVSDRFGRRSSIICSYCLAATAGLLCSMVDLNIMSFTLFRFLVGLCLLPLSEDPYVLALEYIGAEKRTLAVVFWAVSYISSSMVVPWVAKACHNWRLLNVAMSVPLLLPVLLMNFIPESASWLLSKHRDAEAVDELVTVGKWNGREIPTSLELKVEDDEEFYDGKAITLLKLVGTPRIRKHTILVAASWFLTYLIYHSVIFSTSFIGTDIYLSYTCGAAVELLALIFVMFSLDTVGRKWPMLISTTTTAFTGLCGVLLIDSSPDRDAGYAKTRLALLLLMRVAITTHYDIMLQYGAEVYPTILRGRGLAVLRFAGTLSLYISPTLVYTAQYNPVYPIIICGLLSVVLVILTLFLPETRGLPLPQTIEAAERLGKGEPLLGFVCNCVDRKGRVPAPDEEPEEDDKYSRRHSLEKSSPTSSVKGELVEIPRDTYPPNIAKGPQACSDPVSKSSPR
ncbi:solute carrier family 22 member 2 [Galendromus occidentalis]|uniref:Solute carrier family 22 member 2 n=1 Tax=Galendromus occidentalis TaxID=34638 RepID=A0AAJ7L6K7_9ACAR|nr:solute carrier family 22 member 2 [Galendromus occidentalis]